MRAVIFDMDGLMFDTEAVHVKAWNYAGERMGLGRAGEMVLKTMGTNAAVTRAIWEAEYGPRFDEDALRKYAGEFLTEYYRENGIPVKKGLYRLLPRLKEMGCRLAVASSTGRADVTAHLKETSVYEYFDAVICGDMVERSKPEPDIYRKACGALGAAPGDCFALEDSRNGLLSAHRAGCRTLMVPDLYEPDDQIRQIVEGIFPDLDAVGDYLEKVWADPGPRDVRQNEKIQKKEGMEACCMN